MSCETCPAEVLTGRALETRELCEGSVSVELRQNDEVLLPIKNLCGALLSQQIMDGRPRKALEFQTPYEAFNRLLAEKGEARSEKAYVALGC